MEEGSVRYIRAMSAKRYMNVLQEVIIIQMKCVKYENNKELLLMRKLMKAAKIEFPHEQYKVILEKAKELAHFNE